MKKIRLLLIAFIGLTLIGCTGSDVYQGEWKGMTPYGEKVEIVFEPNKMTISDSSSEESVSFDYTQNSVKTVNGIKTYGIKLQDGRGYQINFPMARNQSIGLIKDENENVLYSISRTDYIMSEDIFKLK